MVFQSFWSLRCSLPRQSHRQNGGGHCALAEVGMGRQGPPPPSPASRQPQKSQAWGQPPPADRTVQSLPSATHTAQKTARNPTKHRITYDRSNTTQHNYTQKAFRTVLFSEAMLSQTPPRMMLNFSFKTIRGPEAEAWKRRNQLRGLNTSKGTRRYVFRSISGSSSAKRVW